MGSGSRRATLCCDDCVRGDASQSESELIANPIRSSLDLLLWWPCEIVARWGEYGDADCTFAADPISWATRYCCDDSCSFVRSCSELGPELGVGSRGIGFVKSTGSDIAPPISKWCGSDWSRLRCFFRHLLQQNTTATTTRNDPATPDATEIPMTAPGLIEPSPFLVVSSDAPLEANGSCPADDVGSARKLEEVVSYDVVDVVDVVSEVSLEVVEADVEVVDINVDVEAGDAVEAVRGTSEVLSDAMAELVVVESAVVFASPAIVVLISENTVAVMVLCVLGIAPDTESQI